MAKFVRPGGVFYIREAHPIAWALDFERTDDDLVIALPYFEGEPRRYEQDGTYVEIDEKVQNKATYEWNHGLGEIITALIDAGFRIDALHEYQFIEWQMTPAMVQGDDGMWRLPDRSGAVSSRSTAATSPPPTKAPSSAPWTTDAGRDSGREMERGIIRAPEA